MSTEIDRQSRPKGAHESLTDHLTASDYFPPGTGWNAAETPDPEQQPKVARPAPRSTIELRQL